MKARLSEAQELLGIHLRELGLIAQFEHKFHPTRKWRLDVTAVYYTASGPDLGLAIEISGGIWRKGGHSSGKGILRDYEKLREAVVLGWAVMSFTPDEVKRGVAKETIQRWLLAKSA